VVRSVADVAGDPAEPAPNTAVVHAVDEHRARAADARLGALSVDVSVS
jgi:hypothetical protein